jgi:glutathione S-transferase
MYILYGSPGAASFVVHWLLIETGAPYEFRAVDLAAGEQRSAEYLKLNPNGVVPVLLVDGAPVYEAAALVMLLAERHPAAGLLPELGSRARAHYLQWTLHLANTLQPAFRAWFYPTEWALAGHEADVQSRARARIEATWDRLDAHLATQGPWIAGTAPSAADFYLGMLARWSRNMPRPATEWPQVARLVGALKRRPSFKTLNEREGLTDWS